MIDHLKYATISQIYVKDLIYYDSGKESELVDFCEQNGISLLPAPDRKSCYQLRDNRFIPLALSDGITCNPYDRLFEVSTLKKFETGSHDEVMFVVEDGKIKGVVHIVDYNNDLINFEFYKAVYHFEKMLRGVLHFSGETNDSLLGWMREKGREDNHWRIRYKTCCPKDIKNNQIRAEQRHNCGPFQTFYLNDLLYFISDREYVSQAFRDSIEGIRSLRNWVAHSQDLAYKTGAVGSPLYRIDELKQFVRNANRFFDCFEELEDRVRRDSIPLDYLRNV